MNKFLKEAIEDGCELVVEGLIADNPQWLEQRNRDGYTPLLLAASAIRPHIGCIKALLAAGADVNATLYCDRYVGYTPLMFAVSVMNRNLECIVALIDAGADVNAKTSEGYTILHSAVFDHGYAYEEGSAKSSEFIPLLVEAGAKLEAVNHYGFTPLMVAILESGMSDISALLAVGADPNAIVPNNGKTAFNDGQNMLSFAFWHYFPLEVMQALLHAGADVNLRDAHGRTSLEYWQSLLSEAGSDPEMDGPFPEEISQLDLGTSRYIAKCREGIRLLQSLA